MGGQRVGQHRLDHVAVAAGQPDRVRAVLGGDPGVVRGAPRPPRGPACRPGPRRRGTPPPTGAPARPSTAAPWPASCSALPGPRAVVDLGQLRLGDRGRARGPRPAARRSARSAPSASRRSPASGTPASRSTTFSACAAPGVVELDARGCDRPAPRRRWPRTARGGAGSGWSRSPSLRDAAIRSRTIQPTPSASEQQQRPAPPGTRRTRTRCAARRSAAARRSTA